MKKETNHSRKEQVLALLEQLRGSADIQYRVFTSGSCYKLFEILQVVYPEAEPLWSDRDAHCITKIGSSFYDIGGEVNASYAQDKAYVVIPSKHRHGYSLLKYAAEDHIYSVTVEKYVTPKSKKKTVK